jgi:hypothetical protein
MKKSHLAIVSALSLLLGSTVSISPASAFVYPYEMGTVYLTAGEPASVDMGCQEDNIVDVHFDSGTLPAGLTMDSAGLVTGTPATPGEYTLNGYSCSYNGGSNTGSWPNYYVTFQINAAFTPVPTVVAHSLNTEDCSIYVGVIFPVNTDTGTAFVEISNPSGTVLRSNSSQSAPLGANQLFARSYNIAELNDSANHFNLPDSSTKTLVTPFACGDLLTIKAGYQYRGAPVATQTVDNVIINGPVQPGLTPGSEPTLRVIPLNNAECEFRVIGSLPTAPLAGSTKLKIYSGDQGVEVNNATLTLTDIAANTLIDLTFKADAIEESVLAQTAIASSQYNFTSAGDFCGTNMFVHLDYTDLMANNWTTALNQNGVVYPTRPFVPQAGDYSISATMSKIGTCNIDIVAEIPNSDLPILIMVSSTTEDSGADLLFMDTQTPAGVIFATLSLTNVDDITANIPFEDKSIWGNPVCSGIYDVVIDSPEGTLAATTITIGAIRPVCNSGSIVDDVNARCVEVERGFYTTQLDSVTPIACPKGMTTAAKASKSKNDCYKPIVQSIASFKSPKAMKYKAVSYLPITTNTKANATAKATGRCTVKAVNVVTKVKGKKVTTRKLKVTASTKAGTCKITLTSPAKDKYLGMTKNVQIKVSKTGK